MTFDSPIRVLVADEQRLVAESVAFCVNSAGGFRSRAHELGRGDVLDDCLSDAPDVLVMDAGDRTPTVFDMPRLLRTHGLATRVLLLCGAFTDAIIQWAIDSGVSGLVSKRQGFDVLCGAIRHVHRGGAFRCSEAEARLVETKAGSVATRLAKSKLSLLTEREREMLSLLARGGPIREIATEMHISTRTVESHKFQIMKKLDLHNRIELARFAFREGLANP